MQQEKRRKTGNISDGFEPRLSSGPAFFGGLGLDILRRAQARARLFEKGPENWSFYVVKIRGSSRLGLGSSSTFKARARPGLVFLGLDPSLKNTVIFD